MNFNSPSIDWFTKKTQTIMHNYTLKYNELLSLPLLIYLLGLPYSKEFFDEYVLNETELENSIGTLYESKKTILYKNLSSRLSSNMLSTEEAREEILRIDTLCTPVNYEDSFGDLESNLANKKNGIILSTGVTALDDSDIYLTKGTISTVFAFTGCYKTMFCTNVAYNAIKAGSNVLYVSLEINKDNMYINFLSRHSLNFDKKISHSDVKGSRLKQEDEKYLFDIIYPDFKTKLKSNLIVYDETDIKQCNYSGFSKLLSGADKQFMKTTGKGIDLIIVDHINLFKFGESDKNLSDYAAVNHWMSYFRKNCINFLGQKKQVAILCASQSSREGYKNAQKSKKYELTGIAEANEIERSSQLVLSIFTDDGMKEKKVAKMQVLKMRDGNNNFDIDVKVEPEYYAFATTSSIQKMDTVQETEYDDSNCINDTSVFDDEEEEE